MDNFAIEVALCEALFGTAGHDTNDGEYVQIWWPAGNICECIYLIYFDNEINWSANFYENGSSCPTMEIDNITFAEALAVMQKWRKKELDTRAAVPT